MPRLVGLDIGTSSVKGIAIDEAGTVLRVAERSYPLSTPHPGWAEQDPEDWVRAAAAVLEELDAEHAAGIGLAGQMHGLVALGEDDRPLRPAILWNDGRTQAQCVEIESVVGRERLIELTGNRALAGFTAPKLLWLREHEPDVYARIRRVLLPKDYVRLRLTGVHATDVSDASGTLLFDVAARTWSDELLALLDLDRAWLPDALESVEVSGRTAAGVPVAAGAGDQAAGALGVGVLREEGAGGGLSVVLGTSGVVFAARDAYASDPEGAVHAFCHAVPGAWHVMGVMLSAAGSLQWLRDTVAPDVPFETLLAGAADWEPGAEGLLFAPYLAGERTPYPDPAARGMLAGLTLRHDRGALARAVMEGVAFGLADGLDRVAALGARSTVARVSGGGARSRLWLQIVASVLDVSLERTAVDEGAAFGAALLGGVAGGVFADAAAAAAACVVTADTIVAPTDWAERYAALRPGFTALYPADVALRAAARPGAVV